MASFAAELQLEGRTYPVRQCSFASHQSTSNRGRVSAKVRHEPLHLLLDVPDDDFLFGWANTPRKPLAGQVVFYAATQRIAIETLAFAAGECVQYTEVFSSGSTGAGAYYCQLVITAPAFDLRAGGPAAVAVPAASNVLSKLANSPLVSTVASVANAASSMAGMAGRAANLASTAAALAGGASSLASAASALKAAPEYTLAAFTKTIGGAQHMQPQSVITQLYDLYNAASAASVPGKPSIPDWKAVEDLMRSSYYEDPDDGNKVKPLNGHWPPANGGYQRQDVPLKAGDTFDRYQSGVFNKKIDPVTGKSIDMEVGDEFDVTFGGEFMSPMGQAGTPVVPQSFESRALNQAENEYPFAYTVKILQDVPPDVVSGELAQVIPWYGQPGGGTQMRVEFPKESPVGEPWKYQEWEKMQTRGYAQVDLKSSPNGRYEVLPGNRVKKRV